jgi:hypothetical protein
MFAFRPKKRVFVPLVYIQCGCYAEKTQAREKKITLFSFVYFSYILLLAAILVFLYQTALQAGGKLNRAIAYVCVFCAMSDSCSLGRA